MTTILVADDSATQLMGITKALEAEGYDILFAEDGVQAVEVATNDKPDIILMDVVMPNLNGFQATRQITQNPNTKHIPVIMLTSKDQESDRVWAERQGASDYITKPPNMKELIAKIKALLG